MAVASAPSGELPAPDATGLFPDRTTAVQRLFQLFSEASATYSTPWIRTAFDSNGTIDSLLWMRCYTPNGGGRNVRGV
ncbi:hypothetical protein [Candidatus Amarobacter glycogenicus]|uniref:hypothetical protein n=1 Tax=Candidatus Amarobacter glycogenicus TaxID=3140699 RepID=UPI002A16E3BA|nr:hypothetical protein [Dehalococcoidia bacterium]